MLPLQVMDGEKETKKTKTQWLTKAVMEQIYEQKLWGGAEFDFYSGVGSYDPVIVQPYLEAVILFLKSFSDPITVCDLGCGDFNIGKELVKYTKKYIAVDVVANLILRNKEKFKAANLEFLCLDIAADDFPAADCAIVRQVLQHLSNKEVLKVVDKLATFKYLILTEHLPNGDFIANKDVISGQGIRLKKQSGVDVLKAPFYFQIKKETPLARLVLENNKGEIVSTLYEILK